MSTPEHDCTLCRRRRPGRFTRHKFTSGRGWSRGLTQALWYCWECLPRGQGRGE